MQIDKKEKYTHISYDETSFFGFYKTFLNKEKEFIQENIIIQISNNINVSSKEILLFLDKAIQNKKNGTSFVIVYSNINIDDFPENLNIVPTLQEAEDVIDMENMERELGF